MSLGQGRPRARSRRADSPPIAEEPVKSNLSEAEPGKKSRPPTSCGTRGSTRWNVRLRSKYPRDQLEQRDNAYGSERKSVSLRALLPVVGLVDNEFRLYSTWTNNTHADC